MNDGRRMDRMVRKNYEFAELRRGSFAVDIATTYSLIDPYQRIRDSIQYLEKILDFGGDEMRI